MSDEASTKLFEAIAPMEGDPSNGSQPFEILRAGEYDHTSFGKVNVTQKDLDIAIENFRKSYQNGAEIPVDYDHSFRRNGTSTAAGWFTDLFRKGGSLFARVKWTDKAAELIRNGEFKYFSPEFTARYKDEFGNDHGFAILAGGLTNRPFLRGITEVSLSEASVEEEVAETHGAVADDTKSTDEAQPTELTEEVTPEAVAADDGSDETTITMSAADHATLVETAAQVKALSEALDETKQELRNERFSTIFSQAQREGRVDAKDETRDKWFSRLDKFGFEDTRELLFDLPADTVPVIERGETVDADIALEVEDGVDPDRASLDAKIKAYAAENDVDYAEAALKVAG